MSNKQAIEILDEMINNPFNSFDWQYDLLKEAKEKIQSLTDTDGWISVETPPDHIWKVLVIAYWIPDIASYDEYEEGWNYHDEIADDDVITFWKEIPALPPTSSQQ